MKNERLIFLSVASMAACAMNAQTVSVDGEFRPRVEVRDGFGQPLQKANDPLVVTQQRTRLGVSFKTGLLSTKLTIQDARTWGEAPTSSESSTTDASTSIFEAWAEMVLIPGGSLKMGRQTLKLDDGRLFNDPAWSNTGTTHDMALLKYAINDFQANAGFAYNNNSAVKYETYYSPVCKYRYMGFLWLNKTFAKDLSLSLIGVDEGVQDTTGTSGSTSNYKKVNMYHTYTYGGYLSYGSASSPFTASFTYYYQSGKASMTKKMNASFTAVKVGWNPCNAFNLSAGCDLFSGDDNTSDGTQHNFKKLYGTNHGFNGYMEYWTTPPTQGLGDYYMIASGKATKDLKWEVTGHLFRSMKDVTYATNESGKSLGSELDLKLNYKMNEWATVEGGYSIYFTNKEVKYLKLNKATADIYTPQWCYVMFTITPNYLKNIF
jgi:hypothetical protein